MAAQGNRIAVFTFIVAAAVLLSEVSSLPYELTTRDVDRRNMMANLKAYWGPEKFQQYQNCRDRRSDCNQIIDKRYPNYWCKHMNKGQCDVTCGVASCMRPHARCVDILDPYECMRAKLLATECRKRKYLEGCFKTCCNCELLNDSCI